MKNWLKGGLISVVVMLFFVFIVPIIINLIFCPSGNYVFMCNKVPGFILDMWAVLDFFSWPLCKGFCTAEQSNIQIITTIPSFFVIGVAIGIILSNLFKKRKK